MVLALIAVRHADEQFANPVATPLVAMHCTIGRGQECDIVLEDPTRHVSRKHATITRQGDGYVLAAESRINPVIFNGQAVSSGQRAELNIGDTIVIGDYEFSVVVAPAAGAPLPAAGTDPLAALGRGQGGPVDLDALFGSTPTRLAPAASAGGGMDALLRGQKDPSEDPLLNILSGGDRAAAPVREVHHDEDPLMQILGAGPPSASRATTGPPDEILHRGGTEISIDDLLGGGVGAPTDPLGLSGEVGPSWTEGMFGGGTGGSLELDHVHDVHLPMSVPGGGRVATPGPPAAPRTTVPSAPSAPAALGAESDPLGALLGAAASSRGAGAEDPLGLFGPRHTASAAPARVPVASQPSDEPTGRSPYLSPDELRPIDAPAAAATPAEAVARQDAESTQGVIRAFLEGAAMQDINIPDADADAFVRECGATVRAAVEGIMGMLLARAKVKEELRASDRTMVASKENNALKLIETVDEALRYVFDPATRTDAFLPPPKAVADACSDLQAHEIALVAGMRAALMGAIKRFEPAAIEKKLEKEGGKSLLANKKALLWERFVAYYQETEKEAEDNFDRVFGAAFLRAYQEQIRRLRG